MTLKPALGILIAISIATAWAQDQPAESDPPSRVARLSYLSGSVAFRPGTIDEWGEAKLNYPLTTGDHLWTDAGARAEIHAGLAAIRMAPETALAILNLDDRTIQLSVTQGTVRIHVRSLEPDETIEVATPNVAITLLRPGDYRIDANPDNELTTVTVRGGDAAVTGGGIAFPVHVRQTARIRGSETITEEVGPEIPMDEFERWCESRDRIEEQSVSAQYVPREMTGYQDLDSNGSWSDEPDYGWVWTPRTVAVDWAPYRYGCWRWIEPWGWTWIDDSSWGFAPFHYGRWATVRGLWVWVPGRRTPGFRPVYAPALVVFVGGPRFGVSHAAWFPLGPRELYRPSYRVSERYIRNVNVTHVNVANINVRNINITNVRYVNHRAGAVSAADNDSFSHARHMGRDSARLDAREIEQARVVGTTANIPPRRESVFTGSVRHTPPARAADRTVVVRTEVPPRPVSFSARQRVLEVNQGRPLDRSQEDRLRRDAPARPSMVRVASPARPSPRQETPAPSRPVEPVRPIEPPRRESPRQAEQPREEAPPPRVDRPRRVEQPAPVEVPRSEPPQRIEPRRADPPRRIEEPRQETPRVERPRSERPQVESRRPDPPRQVEQPRRQESRPEPRVERPPERQRSEEPRQQREERKQEQREERKQEQKENRGKKN